jgi:hypothetical protein
MDNKENITNKHLLELNKRIGVMISLLLRMLPKDGQGISLKEQVRILDSLGIRPRDIADILGRSATHINKELTGLRKERSKKG